MYIFIPFTYYIKTIQYFILHFALGYARGSEYIALPGLHPSPGRAIYPSEGEFPLATKI